MVRETRRGRARAAGSSVRVRSRCLSWLGKSRLGSYRVLKGDLRLRYGLGYATQSGGPQNQVNQDSANLALACYHSRSATRTR